MLTEIYTSCLLYNLTIKYIILTGQSSVNLTGHLFVNMEMLILTLFCVCVCKYICICRCVYTREQLRHQFSGNITSQSPSYHIHIPLTTPTFSPHPHLPSHPTHTHLLTTPHPPSHHTTPTFSPQPHPPSHPSHTHLLTTPHPPSHHTHTHLLTTPHPHHNFKKQTSSILVPRLTWSAMCFMCTISHPITSRFEVGNSESSCCNRAHWFSEHNSLAAQH